MLSRQIEYLEGKPLGTSAIQKYGDLISDKKSYASIVQIMKKRLLINQRLPNR